MPTRFADDKKQFQLCISAVVIFAHGMRRYTRTAWIHRSDGFVAPMSMDGVIASMHLPGVVSWSAFTYTLKFPCQGNAISTFAEFQMHEAVGSKPDFDASI
ncbi:MAG TPA: hypothetical protein VEN30_12305 [Paraburkholderia sp.]|nr:hypothetical protein [Paraburkholderia sp.]